MKKLNKVAAQDALRYFEALAVRDEVYAKVAANPAYEEAIGKALDKLMENAPPQATQIELPLKTSHVSSKLVKAGLLIGAIYVLHETGVDTKIWEGAKKLAGRFKSEAARVRQDKTYETYEVPRKDETA